MLAVIACLIGVFGLLVIAELLGRYRILKGEYHRKFLHITAGAFIAFWPWIISWQWIQIIGLAMAVVMLANHYFSVLNYRGLIGRATYGDIFYALAICLAATFTDNKTFFALAILEVALADGLAAVAGIAYGKNWRYSALGNTKTIIGSMVFWLVTLCLFAAGLLTVHDQFTYQQYYLILLLVPPFFTVVENFSTYGLDNILLPMLTLVVLLSSQVN